MRVGRCIGAALLTGLSACLAASVGVRLALGGESVVSPWVLVALVTTAAAAIAGALAWRAGLARENARLREEAARSIALVQRADRLASLGLLAAGLAHEVRNPLVALRTFAQLLPARWDDAEFRHEFSAVVLSEIERTSVLINDLLQFARRPAEPRARGSMIESVTALLPLLRAQAEHKSVTLEFEGHAETPGVAADATQLRQVVTNLVLNAIEATPPGGRIHVSCGRCDGARDARVFIRVSDSGPGIAAADLDRVFEPFFTTRGEGTGLGLAITRQIVQAHGGTIDVQSAPGAGATFTVELPAAAAVARPRSGGPATAAASAWGP